MHKTILIGCPVMDTYEECMERWLTAIKALDGFDRVQVVLADTSKDTTFCERWHDVVDMRFLGVGNEVPFRRIALGMEFLREYALTYDFDYFLCVEIDVIPGPGALREMTWLSAVGNFDYVAHTYPMRDGHGSMIGFGCTIFTREFMKRVRFDGNSPYVYPDTWLWEMVINRGTDFRTCKAHGLFTIDHKNCGVWR